MTMNNYQRALQSISPGIAVTAKHPKSGLWYGIDRIMRTPCTEGFETKAEAVEAWCCFQALYIADRSSQDYKLKFNQLS
jgi:hypothetical protein